MNVPISSVSADRPRLDVSFTVVSNTNSLQISDKYRAPFMPSRYRRVHIHIGIACLSVVCLCVGCLNYASDLYSLSFPHNHPLCLMSLNVVIVINHCHLISPLENYCVSALRFWCTDILDKNKDEKDLLKNNENLRSNHFFHWGNSVHHLEVWLPRKIGEVPQYLSTSPVHEESQLYACENGNPELPDIFSADAGGLISNIKHWNENVNAETWGLSSLMTYRSTF